MTLMTSVGRLRFPQHLVAVFVTLATCVACKTDKGFAPSREVHTLLQTVQIREHLYNLATVAPYDTAQLHVTATMADGSPATDVRIVYTTNIPRISVDSNGVLHATGAIAGNGIVYASVTVGGQTVRDSARVNVTDGPPTLVDSIAAPDFFRFTNNGLVPWDHTFQLVWPDVGATSVSGTPVAFDALGNPIESVLVEMHSSDSGVVKVVDLLGWLSSGVSLDVRAISPGQAWLYTAAYAYGKTFHDSLLVTVKKPLLYRVFGQRFTRPDGTFRYIFDPDSITVPAGSDISWNNRMPADQCSGGFCKSPPLEVKFDEPQYALASRIPRAIDETDGLAYYITSSLNEHGGNGDIRAFQIVFDASGTGQCTFAPPYNCFKGNEARRFDRPGVYRYHSTQGATGVIVVQ